MYISLDQRNIETNNNKKQEIIELQRFIHILLLKQNKKFKRN